MVLEQLPILPIDNKINTIAHMLQMETKYVVMELDILADR